MKLIGDLTADKKILQPGEYICGAEERAGGRGTVNVADEIRAAVLGEQKFEDHEVAVNSQKQIRELKPGDEVYGIITDVMDSKALAAVVPISNEKGVRFGPGETAAIRVQDISDRYVKFVRDEFRIGDLIRARVIVSRMGVDLTTKGSSDYGVIKAFCSRCRNTMVLKASKLICKNCERTETRKLSKYYLEVSE